MDYPDLSPSQKSAVLLFWEAAEKNEDPFDCVDNCRYAVKGNAAQEAAYAEAKSQGCCGFYDGELTCEDGTILLFGFNYGH